MSLQEVYLPAEPERYPPAPDSSFHVNEYFRLIVGRWRLILTVGLLATAAALAHYLLTPKLYRATTMLQIEQRSLLSIGGEQNPWLDAWAGMKYYPTQYRLLKSRGLAERVVTDLRLLDDPGFGAGHRPREESGAPASGEYDAAEVARAASTIQAGLTVDPEQQTELVRISYVSSDAGLAARVVNGVAEAFIDWGIETRRSNVDRASTFLEQQIETLKQQIDDKERQLQDYSRDTDILDLDPQSNVILGRLEQLNQGYTAAIGDRLEKEAQYNELLSAAADTLVDGESDSLVRDLRRELIDMEREYDARLKVYKPDWPEMVERKSRIDDAWRNLKAVVEERADALRKQAHGDYQTALRRERSLKEQIDKAKEAAMDVSSAAVEYKNLEMEISNRRELLDDLLKKLSEAGMSARLQNTKESNVRVIDRALVPGSPFRPSLRNDLTTGLAGGLMLGIGLVLLIHFLDRTVKNSDELERQLGLPVLAVIPDVSVNGSRYGAYYSGAFHRSAYGGPRRSQREKRREPAERLDIELLPERRPRLAVSEAYRSLRTALLLSSAEELKVVTVTSAEASEGKTATAANLAVVMAQMGRRVLLVDADLRKPRLHRIFACSNRAGLVSYLTAGVDPAAVLLPTEVANLTLCPSGPHPPNPSELLSSERMVEFLGLARQRFDFIVIDTPPVLAVTDAIMPGSISDGVVLCFRAAKILREDAKACTDRLRLAEVKVLGAVLNRYRPVAGGYYDRRYHYYESYEETVEQAAADPAA